MAYYKPETHLRIPDRLTKQDTALLTVDIQNYNCHRGGAIYQSLSETKRQDPSTKYFYETVDKTIPIWSKVVNACRENGIEVIHTVIQSLTKDGRDRGLDYKISGFHVPPGSWDAKPLDCLGNIEENDEIIIPKTSSSVFQSTNIDYVLRAMGIKKLIIMGCVTDQCVEHAIRDACDLGYLVTQVIDGCVTYSEERQRASILAVRGYCQQLDSNFVVAVIEAATRTAEH